MTDPVTCPDCEGRKATRIGPLHLGCLRCGGTGALAGGPPASEGLPPVWEHAIWRDPAVAAAIPCRYCMGARVVTSVNLATQTMATVPCRCTGGP
ncbi:hypothetical protein SAMN05421505_12837 [Sinosporangium album]|uniref:Uncharacterized protein n=1 Tax=Sinosporangium album TaxID=504805 RepID=A0A1G8GPW0_9ACTN|nr:hypothetical protein [Sinosporangium album]SDH96330.1 hypothetical protein SAMN05421505_12837 [Sinosporangium album]